MKNTGFLNYNFRLLYVIIFLKGNKKSMATTANLSSIIRYYAEKQKSPFIDLKEFCIYIKKYAEHHVEENAELVKYLGDPTNTVNAELEGLSEKHLVSVQNTNNKKTIISIGYFAISYANQYKELLQNETIPFPIITDLPKKFPTNILERKLAEQYIPEMIEVDNSKTSNLYILDFAREIPPLLLPSSVSIHLLIEASQSKIRKILKKEEFHDYFLKKLRSTNPTKEISIKNFFDHFVDKNENNYVDFEQNDDYYLWNQLLYFIRQDYEKIQDRTSEDTNILQAIQISEIHSTYLKEKFQVAQKREEALKELQAAFGKPPYFYSMEQIYKFQDQHGKLLLNSYSEDDLKEFIQKMTTEGEMHELPPLLIFRVSSGTRYYIYKNKIISVIVRFCNEAHGSISKKLEERWYKLLLEYEKTRDMTDNKEFEKTLKSMVETDSPILHSLLTANFISLLALESNDNTESLQLFVDNHLVSYSDLLMIKNSQILSSAKARLPLIYTIPFISWLISLFKTNKKNKLKKKLKESEAQAKAQEKESFSLEDKSKNKPVVLANKAVDIAKELVPEGSTIDRELDYLAKQWNMMISKDAYNQLTEDVNALIRDYTRRIIKTLSAQTFTRERVENLANTLVRTPNMQKIKDSKALTEYVTLYILRLVSNSK